MSVKPQLQQDVWQALGIADLEHQGTVQLGRGKVISKKDLASTPGSYPVYSSAKENDGKFGEYGLFMFDEELISWSVDGGGRLFHRPRHKFSITNVGGFIRVLRPDRVFCRYLYFALSYLHSQVEFDWVRKAHPSVIRNIYTAIPLPPLEEQRQIVSVLDQAFAALDRVRANAKANLADAAELLASALREKFDRASTGNARLSFDQLCDTITPKVKIQRKEYLDEGAYPIVSQEAESVSGYWNDPGALLGIERPVVVFGDHTRCLKYIDFDFIVGADGTKIMQPKPGISAGYLYFGLRSQPVPEGGYARHFKFVRERTLPDIPFREQEDLARELFDLEEKCAELEGAYRAKLTDIAALRQSLLQKAFAGALT